MKEEEKKRKRLATKIIKLYLYLPIMYHFFFIKEHAQLNNQTVKVGLL